MSAMLYVNYVGAVQNEMLTATVRKLGVHPAVCVPRQLSGCLEGPVFPANLGGGEVFVCIVYTNTCVWL